MGLGGAFAALADDPSALYWNPAGLYQMRDLSLQFMMADMPFDQTIGFFSGVIPINNTLTIGMGWIGLQIDNLEARTANTSEPDFIFQSRQNGFMFSVSKLVSSSLSLGGSIKFIRANLAGMSASGVGFDVAALARLLDRLQIGLVFQDISTDYRWEGNFTEGVPLTVRIGSAYDLSELVKLTLDYSKASQVSPALNFGVEFKLSNSFPIRLGLRKGRPTGGLGVNLPLSNDELAIDYAYGFDGLFNTAVHRVSLGFSFDSRASSSGPDKPTLIPLLKLHKKRERKPE
ncbi:PorV/PorQ family protein [bacterium]|nr:PorV/PorQ family protein [bacterium]